MLAGEPSGQSVDDRSCPTSGSRLAVFRRRPGVPLMTAGLFALSVGLAGGLWAVVDAVALRPLRYPDAHELVAVMERHPERGLMSVTPANFWDWSSRLPAFSDVVGLGSLEASLAGRGTPLRVTGTKVTERFFDVLGVAPAIGRPFGDDDFRSDGRAVDHQPTGSGIGSSPRRRRHRRSRCCSTAPPTPWSASCREV